MDPSCTVYRCAHLFGKRWSLLVLHELHKGGGGWKRFSAVQARMAEVTPRMLSARLKELEAEGLILKRVDASTVPMRSEYSLTEAGRDFIGVIQSLKRWALRWRAGNAACASADCAGCEL